MKTLEIITNNINKSMQKDMKTLGFSRSQCDIIHEAVVPHLHVAFRNGYAMNVYEENEGGTLEVNIIKDGNIIGKESNDYTIEFLNAFFETHTHSKEGFTYATGCYCGLSIKQFIIFFKYFKSIK
jgi:hypothetical protein